MSNELPQGWAEIALQQAGAWRTGGTPSRRRPEFFGKGIRWVKSGDLPDGPILKTEEEITELGLQNSSAKLMPAGTISMALYGATIGKLGVMTFPAATNQACANVIPDDRLVESSYLFYYLLSERRNFIEQGQGGAQPNISQEIVRTHPFRLAPLAEQRRIGAKLERLLDQVDACQQRLAKIPALLKRFRQTVLAAACSGRLTADWREKNPHAEPYAIAVDPNVEVDEEFPTNWRVTRLGTLTALVTSGSRGWAKYYADSGSVFIRAQNINSDFLNLDDIAFVRPPVSAEGLRTKVKQHDLLITITGANVTKSALVEKPIDDAYVSQHVALVRLKDARISEFLLDSVVSLAHGRKQLQAAAYGQGKPGLNLDNIRDVVVGLPPLPEQQEIVRRVESLFVLADRIEARFEEARKRVESISQAILAKAFRGELVPTEFELAKAEGRSFESAEELLERIKGNGKPKMSARS